MNTPLAQHVEHAAAHANWRQEHEVESDLGWNGGTMAAVNPTAAKTSPEDESLLSIFDCHGDRTLYHSLRGQFQIGREFASYPTVSDAPA